MRAYIVNRTNPRSGHQNGEGPYALKSEDGRILYQRWCGNRAFANFDLTRGCQTILEENGITEVHSNDYIVWKDGQATRQTLQEFRQANEEYERLNCN